MDYKQILDYKLLEVLPSQKLEDYHQCYIKYNDKELNIRTPRVKMQDNSIIFKTYNKQTFMDFIISLELDIINYLYVNSSKVFNGKKFTFEKIKSSITPSLILSKDGSIASLDILEPENVKCFDPFGDQIPRNEVGKYVSVILNVKSIVFKKDLFKIVFQVNMIKMSKIEKKYTEDFEESKSLVIFDKTKEISSGDFY